MNVVRDEDGRVWIPGVPPEEPVNGIWHCDGLPAALRAVLRAKGVDSRYLEDTIFAAILGQPFRFWFSTDWASCLAYTYEAPLGVLAAETLGLAYSWHPGGYGGAAGEAVTQGRATLDPARAEEAWGKVRTLLAAGHPVIVFGGGPTPEQKAPPTVLVGYDDARQQVFFLPHSTWEPAPAWRDDDPHCRDGLRAPGYRARRRPDATNWLGSGFAPGQGMGGAALCFFAFEERIRRPAEREIAMTTLRRALAIGRGETSDAYRPGRRGGLAGLALLAAALEQTSEQYEDAGRRVPWDQLGQADWWYAMEGLGAPPYRQTAARFLNRCATDFGSLTAGQHVRLKAAARGYVESAARFADLWRVFQQAGPLNSAADRVATVSRVLAAASLRRSAAAVARQILAAEEGALDELEKALTTDAQSPDLAPVR